MRSPRFPAGLEPRRLLRFAPRLAKLPWLSAANGRSAGPQGGPPSGRSLLSRRPRFAIATVAAVIASVTIAMLFVTILARPRTPAAPTPAQPQPVARDIG